MTTGAPLARHVSARRAARLTTSSAVCGPPAKGRMPSCKSITTSAVLLASSVNIVTPLRQSHVGQQVTLCGWVNRRRDLGSLIFIDMRDREGIVQVFFDPDRADALKLASELRNEFCIQVTGTVRARDEKNVNADMATGAIEIVKCFRDEDLRADRQPEFTQIDVETSFMTAEKVREVMEALVRSLWNDVKGVELGDFPIMTFAEAEASLRLRQTRSA
ncbi:hypothetical protein L1887_58999 [Cichorium endivia]|nr:hypothetical protein L1887_58999 [Cichorium endivia]